VNYFEEQLNADQSLSELGQLIDSIYGWMDKNGYHSQRTIERFEQVKASLKDHRRNVLFLAEFSRGKTELINATIFGDTGLRYLPSSPGRTTRCTTILQYSDGELPSIRLLPTVASKNIQKRPISMLIEDNSVWEETMFSLHDKAGVRNAFKQIAESENVSIEEAKSLGFLEDESEDGLDDIGIVNGMVPIPKWRHALINYPHSLLKQGLRIIDTPGLNALGVEPELTLQALDSAHAIVFVLSADTGITRSELTLWRNHVRDGKTDHIIVVLNKIDLLWDDLKTQTEIDKDIKKQVREVARILKLPVEQIFPVAAQKAMVGRAKSDQRLVKTSQIQRYEQALADTINYTNQRHIVEHAIKELSPTLSAIRNVVKRRIRDTESHLEELSSLHDNQVGVAKNSLEKVQRDVKQHNQAREHIVDLKKDLREGYTQFVRRLDLLFLDRMIASYRYEISNQLTTPGLQREMNDFHAVAVDRFQMAMSYVIKLEKKIIRTFQKVEKVLGVTGLNPRKIEPQLYIDSLKKFQSSHRQHSQGFSMVMTEQHILRDRYHGEVMIKVRKLYKQTRDDVDRWCRTVLVPLELELKERATEIKQRHQRLERVYNKDTEVMDEISDMKKRATHLQQRLTTMDHFVNRLTECGERSNKMPGNVINLPTAAASKSVG